MSILEVNGLKKVYSTRLGGNKVEALKNVNFSVSEGEYVAIMGESGSGKTTLLNILAALDRPTSGSVMIDGRDLSKIKDSLSALSAETTSASCSRISIFSILSRSKIISIFRSSSRARATMRCIPASNR